MPRALFDHLVGAGEQRRRPDIGSQPFFKTIEHDNGILTVSREC